MQKITVLLTIAVVLAMSATGMHAQATAPDAPAAPVRIDPTRRHQVIEGFGEGSMEQWFPRVYRQYGLAVRAKLLDRLFTLKGDGLGLTICRAYMVGGDAPGHNHMKRRPGGSLDPRGYESADGVFTWDGHDDTLWHVRGAAKRKATMVAFWNSPPYWMTVSGCACGSKDGKSNNLRAGLEGRFAKHMIDVMAHYRTAWGVDFDYVCPVNEPESDWWKANRSGQEGCATDAAQTVAIARELTKALKARKLRARIQGPEAAYGNSADYLADILKRPGAADMLATLTCHQYITSTRGLTAWAKIAARTKKPLWMSEWGDWKNRRDTVESNIVQAMNYATKIHEALTVMQAGAWCMWEPQNLFDSLPGAPSPRKSYHAVAHYSRFVRPSMVRIEAAGGAVKTTAFIDARRRDLVVVCLNDSKADTSVVLDLSRFASIRITEARRTSARETFVALGRRIVDKQLTLTMPARSIVTVTGLYSRILAARTERPHTDSD